MTKQKQPINIDQPKNLFKSATFWSLILTILLSSQSNVEKIVRAEKIDPAEFITLFYTLAGTTLTLINAHNENKSYYSPAWSPGRNKAKDNSAPTNNLVNLPTALPSKDKEEGS